MILAAFTWPIATVVADAFCAVFARFPVASSTRVCGMRASPLSTQATQYAYLQAFCSGSDGTRTRDLRRDRPVLALPA
jgi:hypothetical protein